MSYDPITSGTEIANPYREFTYTVAVSGQQEILHVHRYFRVMSISGTASIRFGASGSKTSVIGAGIGIELDSPTDRVTLINEGAGILTITVALAMGKISDDRLNVSGTVSTLETKGTAIQDTADVTLNNGAETQLLAAFSTRRAAIIVADPANTVSVRIGKTGAVGAARGALLAPGSVFSISNGEYNGAIFGYAGAAGQKVSMVEFCD